ncbi:MAG: hypothetical protein E6Q06_03155 [Candidatus Moraniibacteriota bacterium]|nr:MAG: hypothetical protein E6Q06_03155 [Candidatus Moranbacteria bacterium]
MNQAIVKECSGYPFESSRFADIAAEVFRAMDELFGRTNEGTILAMRIGSAIPERLGRCFSRASGRVDQIRSFAGTSPSADIFAVDRLDRIATQIPNARWDGIIPGDHAPFGPPGLSDLEEAAMSAIAIRFFGLEGEGISQFAREDGNLYLWPLLKACRWAE